VLISPFDDRAPVIEIDGEPGDVRDAFIRQRTRLDETMASFTDVIAPTERIVATVGDGVVRVSAGDAVGDATLTGLAEVFEAA
jgi:hypothetical protein